ncbi:DUF4263 domain-containing protein (plasmid) [Pseudomonas sp. Leaf58]|uniref:Shedu anti-phage system protein SduA domain-containing protein n=1 Tax=Pseudomonas sp. Leaf58 TaxID=1736226 RepID=UPI000701E282|nr:Shedu anti-phage system protein SduA domain-containing protein [Pseudomonas sp. Leaf58]AYG48212.1 DUF4263 domain-containing protein [Pseudomonas sp. Leaf58]KQN62239.1 hypothetical protein ASF02_08735 [Pseudomonas sp. Leaf58]
MTNPPYTPQRRQQILESFDATVHERLSFTQEIAAKTSKPPLTASNRYHKQALNQRLKEPSATERRGPKSDKLSKITKGFHNEGRLQKKIEEHPFLLRTPELYAGGLYLDSIITQHTLPSRLRPDFLYATTQGTVIKLVFVEIKSSKFSVFSTDSQLKGTLHEHTVKPLNQVREYKRTLHKYGATTVLLQNLECLFERYPTKILDTEGKLNPAIRIETSFVLVMGTDMPNRPWQQAIIDDLYLREGIIMMTYPMMLEEVSQEEETKNCLKVLARSIKPVSIHKPDLLLAKVPTLNMGPFPIPDPDPYGVTLAGLGWPRAGALGVSPQLLVSLFHRSQGRCEHHDCANPVVQEGAFTGGLASIYNFFKPGLPFKPYLLRHMGLFCNEHHQDVNGGERYPVDRPHPLLPRLSATKGYRFQTDRDRQVFLKQVAAQRTADFCSSLGIDPVNHSDIYPHIGQRLAALTSLPIDLHKKMAGILAQHYGISRPVHTRDQSSADIRQDSDVQRLLQAGMIELEGIEPEPLRVKPTATDQALIELIFKRFPHQASVILMGLGFGDHSIVQLGANRRSQALSKKE